MKEKIKNLVFALSPALYKFLLFKKYDGLHWGNLEGSVAESEILLLKHFLDRDTVFFDVGSNVGAYLYVASRWVAPDNIYGFEPIPELYRRLCRLFKGMHISDVALSDECAQKQFKIPTISGQSLMPRGTLNTDYREQGEVDATVFQVKTQTLDDFVQAAGLQRLDLIKIDVEGHELGVLRGAQQTIGRYQPVLIIEIEQRHHDTGLDRILTDIEAMGYCACFFDVRDYCLKPVPKAELANLQDLALHKKSREYVNNFVFIPTRLPLDAQLAAINAEVVSGASSVLSLPPV